MSTRPGLAMAALLALAIPLPAAAETSRDAAIEERQSVARTLEAKAAARAEAQARAAALGREVDDLRAKLKAASRAMRQRRAAVAEATQALDVAATEAEAAKAEIVRRRRELANLLGAVARLASRPPVALAAMKDGPAEAAKASLAFQALLPEVEQRIADAHAALAGAAQLEQAHRSKLADLKTATAALVDERAELDRAAANKGRLLDRTSAADAALAADAARLAQQANSLDGFIADLAKAEAAAKARATKRQAEADAAVARANAAAATQARNAKQAAKDRARAAAAAAAATDTATADSDGPAVAPEQPKVAQPQTPPPSARPDVARPAATRPEIAPATPAPRKRAALELVGLANAKGRAIQPVHGQIAARYGEGGGVRSNGWVFDASPGAEVFTLFDGRVAYAGPFRGYGMVALIDHGGGYHTLLTGLGALNVAVGDWVLQGELIGSLPNTRASETGARTSEPGSPKLYVELRKDGQPVDPAPWFARPT